MTVIHRLVGDEAEVLHPRLMDATVRGRKGYSRRWWLLGLSTCRLSEVTAACIQSAPSAALPRWRRLGHIDLACAKDLWRLRRQDPAGYYQPHAKSVQNRPCGAGGRDRLVQTWLAGRPHGLDVVRDFPLAMQRTPTRPGPGFTASMSTAEYGSESVPSLRGSAMSVVFRMRGRQVNPDDRRHRMMREG